MRLLVLSLITAMAHLPSELDAQTAAPMRPELSVSAVATQARSSVVVIRTYDDAGEQVALGSGFIVAGGRVVTNAHVVAGASRAEVVGSDGQLLLTTTFAEALSTEVDLAVLARLPGRTRGLPLARGVPALGEHVVVIGAPEGLTYSVTDGIVSGERAIRSGKWLQISAPISAGSSGGPVLNLRGEVVGVSVASLEEGQNLNFAIPAADIRAVINSPAGRIPFPTGEPQQSVAQSAPSTGPGYQQSQATTAAPRQVELPPSVQRDQQFEIRLKECAATAGGRLVCQLTASNRASNSNDDQTLYLLKPSFRTVYGVLVPVDMQLGDQQAANISGLIVDNRIPSGTEQSLFIVFSDLPPDATDGELILRARAGFGGDAVDLTYREVAIGR